MSKIDILMATYNGGQYIEEQIESIRKQSFDDWRLLIHDDGSNDDTITIVKKLYEKDRRIILIEDGIKCGGSAANFMHIVQFADADFVMFADQDDIWFDNKLQVMFDEIQNKDNAKPQIVYSGLNVWTKNTGIGESPVKTKSYDLKHYLFWNTAIHGCVSMFNRPMLSLMKRWKGVCMMHDASLQLLGVSLGNITYLDVRLMLYRRHDSTITGETITKLNDVGRLVRVSDIPVLFEGYFNMVKYLYENYKQELSASDIGTLELFLNMRTQSVCGKILSVFKGHFKLYNSTFRLIVKIIIRPYIR